MPNTVTIDDVIRRLMIDHRERFESFYRHVSVLSTLSLTLLVGLQSSYVPENPVGQFLLPLSWATAALCILTGLLVLHAHVVQPLTAANELDEIRRTLGDEAAVCFLKETNGLTSAEKPWEPLCRKVFLASFGLSILAITAFATLNHVYTPEPDQKQQPVLLPP